ncbi:unnamed protein product, partial [Mesorhabditis belari]|uniref:Permuted papain-like amidase enzyme, YaeF/YiiX, C92 family n=1 Tax=Mesorhabditis belari TaxID=2138241 RepID=A0AAF3EI00_9BILA
MNPFSRGFLIFFFKKPTENTFERAVIDVVDVPSIDLDPHHVGICLGDDLLIHAPTIGVKKETIKEALSRSKPEAYEIWRFRDGTIDGKGLERALSFAESKAGCEYNDIFSPNFRNSKGQESYYCSQLVAESFKADFPCEPMNFRGKNGDFLQYWVEYFAKRHQEIPQDQPGSHPAKIRKAECLERVTRVDLRDSARL